MRGGNVLGRFDPEFEVKSIYSGISQDLQRPVGQEVLWYLFDPDATTIDPIYDTGAQTGGRVWKAPFALPVVNAYVFQNEMYQNDRGFYTVDTLRLFINFADVERYIPDLETNPDVHMKDRCVFRDQMYAANRIFPRGQVDYDYMMLTVDLTQVKPEEQVNDRYGVAEPPPLPHVLTRRTTTAVTPAVTASGTRTLVRPAALAIEPQPDADASVLKPGQADLVVQPVPRAVGSLGSERDADTSISAVPTASGLRSGVSGASVSVSPAALASGTVHKYADAAKTTVQPAASATAVRAAVGSASAVVSRSTAAGATAVKPVSATGVTVSPASTAALGTSSKKTTAQSSTSPATAAAADTATGGVQYNSSGLYNSATTYEGS